MADPPSTRRPLGAPLPHVSPSRHLFLLLNRRNTKPLREATLYSHFYIFTYFLTLATLASLLFSSLLSLMNVMPPPHSIRRRRSAPLASKSADSQLEGQASKLAKDARRRRVELRRIRTFSQAMSTLDSSPSANVDKLLAEMQKEATEGAPADSLGGGRRRSSYGKISVVGRRREMDDVVAVELDFLRRAAGETYDFFGVFDWHEGRRVARACSQLLHRILAKIVEEQSENEIIDWEEVMLEGFDEMEAKINNMNGGAPIVGSSTVVAVVGDTEVVVGTKCDGSKAVLCSGGVAVRLLDDEKEMKINHREEEEEVVQVRVITRRHADEFLILGSDGFWDVVSDELACQIASAAAYTDGVEAAAALMAEFAVAQGSKDNISVVLVDLGGATTSSAAATT